YIVIFDADFVPPRHFLVRTLPYFQRSGNERTGFVQARWGHLNPAYSLLTRCQALALDGHFIVEQGARAAAGYPFGFNGSAGVWRRRCLEDPAVGGWQTDTLCEDLDLSYRAQLAGWRGVYLEEVEAPGEIPVQLLAFKRQQFRWAKGSIQTLRKLGGRVCRHPWPFAHRLAALLHLGNYLIHPLLLAMLLVALPMVALGIDPAAPLAYLSLFSFGPPLLYAVAQRRLHPSSWLRRWAILPLLMILGTGLSLNNTIAVLQGLTGKGGAFLRTPKFQVREAQDRWQQSAYRLPLQPVVLAELGLALYAALTMALCMEQGRWSAIPFLAVYAAGFGAMAGIGVWQAWQSRPAARLPDCSIFVKALHHLYNDRHYES
ncbi:MAG TPA: glycosyltransferase family 2 protein, partial [Caldilineaceae bacterium]|nr:glycosyltransferase family 2 protein [Caldilineaceae bacterium]